VLAHGHIDTLLKKAFSSVVANQRFMGDSPENRGRVKHFHGLWCAAAHGLLMAKAIFTLAIQRT
jgi:hypothetical protein